MINVLFYQILTFTIDKKIWKKPNKSNKLKISVSTWNQKFELPDLPDHILFQIFKTVLSISLKNMTVTDNSSIRIYRIKKENENIFKINTGYYLELSTPDTTKLLEALKVR